MFTLLEIMPHLMRPAGGGIPIYSTGDSAAMEIQSKLYGILQKKSSFTQTEIDTLWKKSWAWLAKAKTVLIGVPSDTGAGIRRGAAYGPLGVRKELLKLKDFRDLIRNHRVVDLGDIFVNPHLLHDDMLSEEQKRLCRYEMYKNAPANIQSKLPVSPLSVAKVLFDSLTEAHPHLRIQIIGGDHSVAWPVTEVLAKKFPGTLGIVQSDAHTDLLPSRLGVKYCFGTWSYHASALIGGNGKLVQLGIRQTGRDRNHWESTVAVKQFWAQEINAHPKGTRRNEPIVIQQIIDHLKAKGVKQVYFSNDIDGTDEAEAPATGTPAREGLSSAFLLKVIQALGKNFDLVATDIMEVAPVLGPDRRQAEKTCRLAATYLMECLRAP